MYLNCGSKNLAFYFIAQRLPHVSLKQILKNHLNCGSKKPVFWTYSIAHYEMKKLIFVFYFELERKLKSSSQTLYLYSSLIELQKITLIIFNIFKFFS